MIRLEYTHAFKRNLRQLARRYRNIRADLDSLIEQLQQGETPGDQIPGQNHTVYKTRLANRDARKGKSGGYRVIYYIKTDEHILLVIIYSKSDQSDISADQVNRIIEAEAQ